MKSVNRIILITLSLSFFHGKLAAQDSPGLFRRYISTILNDTTSKERPKFVAYPTLAYAPETKWEFGISSLYVYYANRDT
ncbi:MAG: hypothetical protein R3345_11165, partial [Fulvivirga sp.]|nr:hypothetical protein [Fulvivirga sp.]